ncbi:MAG: hypothetical protein ACRD18_04370 [Terriglobia bacterium]
MAQELTFPMGLVDDSETLRKLQTLARRQRVDLMQVELKLGLGFFRIAQLEHSVGERQRAEQNESQARRAYEISFTAFAGGRDLGRWQKHRMRGKLGELARLLLSCPGS